MQSVTSATAVATTARANDSLHMPKVAVSPLRSSSYCFPHASPVFDERGGEAKSGPAGPF